MTAPAGRVPTSTYRLQITEDFDLVAAARVLPYLHDLGVDWVYLSPILAAETDSEHGYDVADHSRIDPARGGGAGLAARRPGGPAARHGRARRHRAQPCGRREPRRQRLVVERAHARSGVAVRRGVRHRLGRGRRSAAHPRGRRRRRPAVARRAGRQPAGRGRPAALLRQRLSARAGQRRRPRRRGRRRRHRARAPALRARRAGGSPTPASTTGGSSRSARSPPSASRSASGSTRRTR